jgi:2-hydroxy-3-oxopropionate reductase
LKQPPAFYVYILECADGTYYTGYTSDLKRRIRRHTNGEDKRAYTYSRRPVRLAWFEEQPSKEQAKLREKQVKTYSRQRKAGLILEHSKEHSMAEKPRIGYIGLGLMGKNIARNIMKAGFTLVVHSRSQAPVDELVAEGAIPASTPAEVARMVDIVFTCLPDSPDVELVALGPQGIIEAARPGLIYVDNSTIKPATARRIAAAFAEAGVACLDAPVSGGEIGARQATLAIMVGGEAETLEKVMPVFQAMGKTVTLVGGAGAGQIAKAANQIMAAAQMVAMSELMIFAQKAGADPRKVVEAIRGGAAQCWTLEVKPPRLFAGNRQPGFKAHMQAKDLNIVLDTAREYGIPLPSAALDAQLYRAMLAMEMGDLDNSAVIGVLEVLAGVKLQEE